MELPFSAGISADPSMKFSRKLTLANPITAMIWNNVDPAIDANGDTIPGGELTETKPSLVAFRDIFTTAAISKNNAQGYGLPIMDPWPMRDLKSGINFLPSALSVISGGFGNPMTTQSGSVFMPDGTFSTANYWKYVSVWSGAIVFTEDYQIRDYKAFRTSLGGKSWMGTELALVGAPFMVTHGVKPVSKHVLGGPDELYNMDDQNLNPAHVAGTVKAKHGCSDCHAAGAEFFTGGFEMLGPAVPADRTFNPTSQLSYNAATGNYDRVPGFPALNSTAGFMNRPLEPIRVKADLTDLTTEFEGMNKLGQPRNTVFHKIIGASKVTVPIERADVLYPRETANGLPYDASTNVEVPMYYKITDWDATGNLKTGAVAMTGRDYAAYMETLNRPLDTADAMIVTINAVAPQVGQIHVTLGKPVALVANTTGNGPATTYTWKFSDGSADLAGVTQTKTFTANGAVIVTLTAHNPNGPDSISSVATQNVFVDLDKAGTWTAVPAAPVNNVTVFTPSGAAPAYTKVRVAYGDGAYDEFAVVAATFGHAYKQLPAYLSGGSYKYNANFYFYNGKEIVYSATVAVSNAPTSDLVLSARMSRAYDKLTNSYSVRKGTAVSLIYYLYNEGPADNANIHVNVPANAGLTFVSAATSNIADTFAGTTWTVANLKKGQTATLTVKVTVGTAASYAFTGGSITSSTPTDAVPNVATTFTVNTFGVDSGAVIGGTTPGAVTAASAAKATITVTMPYTGNQNNNNSFTVKYRVSPAGAWKTLGLVGHMPSNPNPTYTFTTTNAVGDAIGGTFDVQVTYNDPAAVYGANGTQTVSGVVVLAP
jgi:hypothetical protein